MATHSSVLAWRIPGMGEPGALPSMGLHRVRHGWSRDAFVSPTTRLIQLDRITVPTLLIYGDADPNLDYEQLSHALDILPEDSERCIIEGGSHIVMYEEPYYHEFQNQIISFLLQ